MTTTDALRKQINTFFKKEVLQLGSDPQFMPRFAPTGLLPIDILFDGGLPIGRITEIFGNYSTLKSYIAYHAMGETQRRGGKVALVDTEHSWDPSWGESIGVNTDDVLYLQPDTAEEGVDVIEVLTRAKCDLIVWDSIAASTPKEEAEKTTQDKLQPGRLAALMSRGLRKIVTANKNCTAVLCLNQTREKIGITFGSPETTPGGKALPFYASYRLRLAKAGEVSHEISMHDGVKTVEGKEYTGMRVRASLEKSKLSRPFRDCLFYFDYQTGAIDIERYIMSVGLERGLIAYKGAQWWIPGTKIKVNGRDKFHNRLRTDEKLRTKLTEALLSECRGSQPLPSSEAETPKGKRPAKKAPASIPVAEADAVRTTTRRRKRITSTSSQPAAPSPS